jgi:hypothetical protein
MVIVLVRNKLTINEKVNIYLEGGEGSSMSQIEITECSVFPPLSLSNIILWKTSILEEKCWYGAKFEKLKKLCY